MSPKVFDENLRRALVTSNVNLGWFLKKYCKFNISSDRIVKRNNIDFLFLAVTHKISTDIENNYFCIFVD